MSNICGSQQIIIVDYRLHKVPLDVVVTHLRSPGVMVYLLNVPPNGLRLSRLAGYAGLGSSILRFPQRTYQRRLQPKANSVPTACWASTISALVDDICDYRLRKITNTELRKRVLNMKLAEYEFRMVYSNHQTARLRPLNNTS